MSIIAENNDPHFIFVFRIETITDEIKKIGFEWYNTGLIRYIGTQDIFTKIYNKYFLGKEDFYGVSHFGRFEKRNAYEYSKHVETFLPGKGLMSAQQKTQIQRNEAQQYLSKY